MSVLGASGVALLPGHALAVLDGLAFVRPPALFALAIPLLLLALAKLLARPERRATGSLRLWMRLAAHEGEAASALRPGIPLPLWLLSGSFAAAILALAGPHDEESSTGRLWRIIVDRSPSMYLRQEPALPIGELAFMGARSEELQRSVPGVAVRLEVALDAALSELAKSWKPNDRLRYESENRESLDLTQPVAPRPAWWGPGAFESAEPDFVSDDARGTLFVTDRAQPLEHAGLFASGGGEVYGLLGRRKSLRLEWAGGSAFEEQPASPRLVSCVGNGAVAEVLEHWCLTRGFSFTRATDGGEEPALRLDLAAGEPPLEPLSVERDGWRLEVRVGLPVEQVASPREPREIWLQQGTRELVVWSPGRIEVNWTAFDGERSASPGGDPAAFAVSWSRLFDRAVLPEPGAVSLAERQSAGDPRAALGEPPIEPAPTGEASRYEAWLAWLAAALAAAAAWSLSGSTTPARDRRA